MALNPVKGGGLVTYQITVGGNPIPDSVMLYEIEIEKEINRIPAARIIILDGDASTGLFPVSSSATFLPGQDIVIEAGYDSKNSIVFKGIITGQNLYINEYSNSKIEVVCRDSAVKMIVGRKCVTFSKQTDSDIITSIIGNYSELASNVTSTSTVWPEQVQYYVTDWDFILTRAETNGLIVSTLNGTITIAPPDNDTTSVLTATYGVDLLGFNADINAINQLTSVVASGWDFTQQAISTGQASNSYSGPGNLSSETLSAVVGLSAYQLQSNAPLETADLSTWSKAQMMKNSFSKIRGEAKFQGTSVIEPGNYVTFQGLGDRFNGDYLASGVRHLISEGNWLTEIKLGLSPEWFIQQPDVIAPPASGILPGAKGLLTGTVKQMYEDPDSQYRVLLTIPAFDQNGEGIWARIANFYSTSGGGAFFLPEVGDEVVVGFLNEDPRFPIILGSLYSSTTNEPYTGLAPDQNNTIKAIASKTGILLKFDDENKILTITTPGSNEIILDDKEKQITMQDSNNNSLVMSSSGITIKSGKDINIQATQNISISGDQGIKISSSGGDVTTSGSNISCTADVKYSITGSTATQINGGMELTISGDMVMIN